MDIRRVLVVLLLLSISISGAAQVKAVPQETDLKNKRLMNEMRNELVKLNDELDIYRSEQHRIEADYAKKYYSYLADRADANIEQLKWQRSASEKLFWVVVLVVFSGVAFSGFQLWRATQAGHSPGESTVELEAQRIRITSSIVGVAVLAISMMFFYFFLVEVYRIRVVDMSSSDVKPFSAPPHVSSVGSN